MDTPAKDVHARSFQTLYMPLIFPETVHSMIFVPGEEKWQ